MPRRIPTRSAVTIQLSTISTPAERLLSIKPGPVDPSILERAEAMGWTRIPVLTDDGDLAHEINDIRNRVMHPIQPLVPRERNVVLVRDAVSQMIHLTDEIRTVSNGVGTPSAAPTR